VPASRSRSAQRSPLLVVDEDEPGGFQQYADSVGQTVPDTYTVRTGKGTHFYFTANGSSHGNSPGPLAQFGCDVRGDGGYVLAAGSTHPSGAVYHVASDCNVAPLPGWLADALDGNSGPFTDPTQPFELPDVIKAGERDQVLFRYACQLRAQGTKVVAAARLIRAVHGRCEQPAGDRFTVAQALAKIDQAWGYDAGITSTEAARPASGRTVRLTPAATIKPRPVRWIWDAPVPLGEITMTPGRGGVGKSTFHAWLIAHLTRGTLPGVYLGVPRPCIIAASEDSWERTIVGRLIAAGADMSLVFRAEVIVDGDLETSLTLPADCAALEVEIRRVGAVLLSVDPLISTVAGRLDTHKDRDVRQALQPLAQPADRTGCTVLGNAHFGQVHRARPAGADDGFGRVRERRPRRPRLRPRHRHRRRQLRDQPSKKQPGPARPAVTALPHRRDLHPHRRRRDQRRQADHARRVRPVSPRHPPRPRRRRPQRTR
jgi:AAA domain/Bifunctional DNA primase/polymerase, N-terminal